MIVPNGKQTEGGYVLVTVAATLIILVGFTALAMLLREPVTRIQA